MDDHNDFPILAEFFYHAVGDKSAYSPSLESLFVCYTLTRGLRVEGSSPRRPALPLEIILQVIRLVGYTDAKPDPTLTLCMDKFEKYDSSHPLVQLWCISPKLTRKHLASIARIQIIPLYDDPAFNPSPETCLSECIFKPFLNCYLIKHPTEVGFVITPSLSCFYCQQYSRMMFLNSISKASVLSNPLPSNYLQTFVGDNAIIPVRIACHVPSRVIFWRYWEPQF
ncbi:hypothetical protein FRC12_012429 [Ceratobasidium sp. 428]|nr:hypothetical protein FRC12_012429 [Ceratobasidium sp. 428]